MTFDPILAPFGQDQDQRSRFRVKHFMRCIEHKYFNVCLKLISVPTKYLSLKTHIIYCEFFEMTFSSIPILLKSKSVKILCVSIQQQKRFDLAKIRCENITIYKERLQLFHLYSMFVAIQWQTWILVTTQGFQCWHHFKKIYFPVSLTCQMTADEQLRCTNLMGSAGSQPDKYADTASATSRSVVTSHSPSVPITNTSSGPCLCSSTLYTITFDRF